MKAIKQQFYEKAYPEKEKKPTTRSILGGFYNKLQRFETYREDVVFGLLPQGDNFLDIGSGNGSLSFKALSKFQDVYGIDIANTRLLKAEKSKKALSKSEQKRVKFLLADADGTLPFANNFFDAVTMVATLEHFFDPFHVMDEVKRVLKKSGLIVIQVPNLSFLPRRIAVLLGKLPVTSEDETGWDGGHLHYFTLQSLISLLNDYSLTTEIITCSGVFAKLRKWWVSMLGADVIISARK